VLSTVLVLVSVSVCVYMKIETKLKV
jgi:hypothetical protein